MIINYVREHMRFIEYAKDDKFTASERLLWYALMHIFNARAEGNEWPDDFIRIDNDRLLMYVPFDYDTLVKARNGLKQKGRIDYRPGDKRKSSPCYRMIYFYPGFIPKKSDNLGGNPGGNMGDIYINLNNKEYTETEKRDFEEEEEETYQRAREETVAAWVDNFGERPRPGLADWITNAAVRSFHFEGGVIRCGIEHAARKGTRNVQQYLMTMFDDWYRNGVKTEADAERYLYAFAAERG